jgi:hypothetical protein
LQYGFNGVSGGGPSFSSNNITFEKKSNERTYNYKIDLNEEIRNVKSIRLVDYSISKPTTLEMKDYPCFILKVNDYQLVEHHSIQDVFKSIPYNKMCECDVKNANFHFDNSNNVIRSIHIQLCKLDTIIERDGSSGYQRNIGQSYLTELDNGSTEIYHNSFLFEITQHNSNELCRY